jgi:hypothetical protein
VQWRSLQTFLTPAQVIASLWIVFVAGEPAVGTRRLRQTLIADKVRALEQSSKAQLVLLQMPEGASVALAHTPEQALLSLGYTDPDRTLGH